MQQQFEGGGQLTALFGVEKEKDLVHGR